MKKYTLLLFDADDTLFDFAKAEQKAFAKTLCDYGENRAELLYPAYQTINEELWRLFEQEMISKQELQSQRFTRFCAQARLSFDGAKMNGDYLKNLAECDDLIGEALSVCRELSQNYRLAIVTNGITYVQHRRFEKSAIRPYFSDIFVSEEAGAAKPSPDFFRYVFRRLAEYAPEQALIIGDSLTSDMRGGNLSGIDTCWYNPKALQKPEGIVLRYEISSLSQLPGLLAAETDR